MKIALVCDWLTGMRGGEKCLEALCQLYKHTDIFTLVYYPNNFNGEFQNHRVTTSFIQKLPGNDRTFRRYLPLFPKAIESFDLTSYDLVISFSHCVAKSVIVPDTIGHICYCHTPVRYAWHMRDPYLKSLPFIKRKLASHFLNKLQKWDRLTANRVDHFLANSKNVQQRINECYARQSRVIYPPVDIDRFAVSHQDQDYYLILSAMVPYKRIDLAIQAFNQNSKRLTIAGSGVQFNTLKKMAGPNIEFVPSPDNKTVEQLYANCKALIFPGEEDFGNVPLEAQASGKPVIAYAKGGALETVIDSDKPNPTGVFFKEQTVHSLCQAVEHFESSAVTINPEDCRRNAERFDVTHYIDQMAKYIESVTQKP